MNASPSIFYVEIVNEDGVRTTYAEVMAAHAAEAAQLCSERAARLTERMTALDPDDPAASVQLAEAVKATERVMVWAGPYRERPACRADFADYIHSCLWDLRTIFHMAATGHVDPETWGTPGKVADRMLAGRCFDNHAGDHGLVFDIDLMREREPDLVARGLRCAVWLLWRIARHNADEAQRSVCVIDGAKRPLSGLYAELWPADDQNFGKKDGHG